MQRELVNNLTKQGHIASGKLAESIQFDVFPFGNFGQVLEISFFDYGKFVDTGRRKNAKRVPIKVLIDWIIERGIARGDANVLGAAFAIREKIFQEGIPTRKSLRFSSTGKRTMWFTEIVDDPKIQEKIVNDISNAVFTDVEVFFDNIIEQNRKAFA